MKRNRRGSEVGEGGRRRRRDSFRLGGIRSVLGAVEGMNHPATAIEAGGGAGGSVAEEQVRQNRENIASFFKSVGRQLGGGIPESAGLAPRARQTLERLLAGESEKQIAHRLELSIHTVHVYVKKLYRHFEVSSRGELLSRWANAGSGKR